MGVLSFYPAGKLGAEQTGCCVISGFKDPSIKTRLLYRIMLAVVSHF